MGIPPEEGLVFGLGTLTLPEWERGYGYNGYGVDVDFVICLN